MAGFKVDTGAYLVGEWSDFDAAVHRLSKLDFRGLHEDLGETLLEATERHFREETGPDGPWERSAAAAGRDRTKSGRKRKHGGKTLQATSRLKQSINYDAEADHVEVGSNVVYAAIHQFGGKTGRGHAVELPARPYLYIEGDSELEQDLHDVVHERLREVMG